MHSCKSFWKKLPAQRPPGGIWSEFLFLLKLKPFVLSWAKSERALSPAGCFLLEGGHSLLQCQLVLDGKPNNNFSFEFKVLYTNTQRSGAIRFWQKICSNTAFIENVQSMRSIHKLLSSLAKNFEHCKHSWVFLGNWLKIYFFTKVAQQKSSWLLYLFTSKLSCRVGTKWYEEDEVFL